jgi:beta-lactamase regulating signal transducer with metallopeptidase domain
MNTILWWLAQNTVAIAILIPIVAAACRLCRNRPAVQHALWAVVLLKFLTPPLVSWPWPVQELSPPAWLILAPALGPSLFSPGEHLAIASDDTPIRAEALGDLRRLSTAAHVDAAWQARSFANRATLERAALGLLTALWGIGILVCTARQVRRIGRHAALVRLANEAPEQLTSEIEAVADQIGLRPPRALVARGIVSPFMWFLGKLRLVWPETMSGRDEVVRSRGVIAHELAHVRRGDHYLSWAELVAGLLWWWNPLFWFVRRRLHESAELACDAIALSVCPQSRRTYAELLLELSSSSGPAYLTPVLGIRAGTSASFETRLSMILSDRVCGTLPKWGRLAAASLAIVSLPGWSLAQKPAEITVTSPDGTVRHDEQDGRAAAARLDQIESELKRLSRMLAEAKQSVATATQPDKTQSPQITTPKWRNLPVINKTGLFTSFEGARGIYLVGMEENKAYLRAFDKVGQQVWLRSLVIPPPVEGPCEWTIKESDDQKQVLVTWTVEERRASFVFVAANGETVTETIALRKYVQQTKPKNLSRKLDRGDSPSVADWLEELNTHGSAYRKTLAELLKLEQTSSELTQTIFRRLLNRDPTPDELARAMKHLATGWSRAVAVEDIFWVIINSREYQSGHNPRAATGQHTAP